MGRIEKITEEYEAKIRQIFKEIEKQWFMNEEWVEVHRCWWQELKEKYLGGKDER